MKNIFLFACLFLMNSGCYSQQIFFQCFDYTFQVDSSLFVKYKLNQVVLKDYKFNFLPNQKPKQELVVEKVIWIDSLNIRFVDSASTTNTVTLPQILVPYYSEERLWRVDYFNAENIFSGFDLYVFDEYKLLNQLCHYEFNSTGEINLTEKIKVKFKRGKK